MMRSSLASLAGAWLARDAERGHLPEKLAVPLTLLVSRLPTPVLIAGAIGYGLYRMNIEARASRARDVTPKRRSRSSARKPSARKPSMRRSGKTSAPVSATETRAKSAAKPGA